MEVTSLYTNIPQERELVHTVCKAYDTFYKDTFPFAIRLLDKHLG